MKETGIFSHRAESWWLGIAGVLIAVGMLFHPDESQAGAFASTAWGFAHILVGFGFLAAVLGLSALYQELQDRLTGIEAFAFWVALATSALISGVVLFFEGIVVPVVANNSLYASLLSETGPLLGGTFGVALQVLFGLFGLSAIGLGAAVMRSKELNAFSGVLLLGALLPAFSPPLPHMLALIGGVAYGVGLLWVSLSLYWATKKEMTRMVA